MARARYAADAETMRDRILRAAEQIIRQSGLARATTRQIAEAVPCSEGSLYRHFKSKEEIFLAVLTEQLPALLPVLRELNKRAGKRTLAANLEHVGMAALSFYDESIPMFASIFSEPHLLSQQSEWMRTTNTGPHRAIDLVADYLRTEQDLGRVRAEVQPGEAAAMLLGACYMRSFARYSAPPGSGGDRRFVRRVVANLMLALRPVAEPGTGS